MKNSRVSELIGGEVVPHLKAKEGFSREIVDALVDDLVEVRNGNNMLLVSPDRGGLVSKLKLKGTNILYMDWRTFFDKTKSVKGGIPIMFPNAGPLDEKLQKEAGLSLPQHGFARNLIWKKYAGGNGIFGQVLKSDNHSKVAYPYDFEFSVECELDDTGLTIPFIISNVSEGKDMPVSMGFHPYFLVPGMDTGKSSIGFDFEGGDNISQQINKKWLEDGDRSAIKFDNPGVPLRVNIPELGTLVLHYPDIFKEIWVWSMPGRSFICIEPVMRTVNGLINDPVLIKPGNLYNGNIRIELE